MSDFLKKTVWALAIGMVLVQVFPVAAELLVCIAEQPDPGCCETPSTPDARTGATAQLVDAGDCSCCVEVQVVSNATGATVLKVDAHSSVDSGDVRGQIAPITRPLASVGNEEPDNPRLPSIRTVVLLI